MVLKDVKSMTEIIWGDKDPGRGSCSFEENIIFLKVIHIQCEAHKTNTRQWKVLRDVTIN